MPRNKKGINMRLQEKDIYVYRKENEKRLLEKGNETADAL